MQDQRLAVAAAAETAISGRQSVWSDEPFDASVLDGFEGNVKLTAKRLVLADGMGLSQASVDIALQGGKVEVKQLEGACLGGRCSATLSIAKAPAGVDVSGSLSLAGGTIEALAGSAAGKPRASGAIGGEIKFSGKGTSPRSVLSVLQGSGTLELGDAKLGTLWPGAIGKAVEAALKSDPDSLAAILRRTLAAEPCRRRAAASRHGRRRDRRRAARGQAVRRSTPPRVARKARPASTSRRSCSTPIGGSSQKRRRPADKAPLPGVTVSYRGPVAALASLEPRIDSEALERELAVRRMERDVEELERLRRLDEARRREEPERQRRQLEQAPLPAARADRSRPAAGDAGVRHHRRPRVGKRADSAMGRPPTGGGSTAC